MRVAVLGGGPAGLYFSTLWKERHPDHKVCLFEQNPANATFGFGIVFSDQALGFLRDDDPKTYDLINPHMEFWNDLSVTHKGQTVPIDGVGFSAIGRLELLQLLQQRMIAVGVDAKFDCVIQNLSVFDDFDLVVAADGINSIVRNTFAKELGSTTRHLTAKFVWFGTTKPFDTLTQTFIKTELGQFNAHHYRYAPGMSTFLVESNPKSWTAHGFDKLDEVASRSLCEQLFAETLGGHPLVSNRSVWREFPWVWNDRWSHEKYVLVGDALRTAHYSIGSGTRLALEDVIALVRALDVNPGDLQAGFEEYEKTRRPTVEKLVSASKASAEWYESYADHMKLGTHELAYEYMMRTGRLSEEELKSTSPVFYQSYLDEKSG